MSQHYQIIGLNKTIGQLSVKYWTDDYPEGLIYSVDLPVDENLALLPIDQIEALVLERFPTGQIEALVARINLMKSLDLTAVEQLVVPLPSNFPDNTIPVSAV